VKSYSQTMLGCVVAALFTKGSQNPKLEFTGNSVAQHILNVWIHAEVKALRHPPRRLALGKL
jgi:hypothetical protein